MIIQFVIYSDYFNQINAIDAILISNQSAINALLTNFTKIRITINTKMSKIKKLYKLKKNNLTKIISLILLIKLVILIKNATRYACDDETKN